MKTASFILALNGIISGVEAFATTSSPPKIIFSDIDGSLLHYPTSAELAAQKDDDDNKMLALPPSATGLMGVISSKTLAKCRDLRSAGVPLVLISGMRTSTLLNRLPYLPKADAYCTEAGGRIFYPIPIDVQEEDFLTYEPLEYSGAKASDLVPFGLREDLTWRERMEDKRAAGVGGYAGNEVSSIRCMNDEDSEEEECLIDYDNPIGFPLQEDVIPIDARNGRLWDFAQELESTHGLVLDTKSYSTCFRVNKKHQTEKGKQLFHSILNGEFTLPSELQKSTNLGCIDIYPSFSGKRNCCRYIADKLGINISTESACICDDDNDVEMALACSHSYVPLLTSESMRKTMEENPTKFTSTWQDGRTAIEATEAALQLIEDQVLSNDS
jgi:hydroxymethylpyrimidine pyrophosphatase-like HAD family hydrolase